MDFTKEQIEKAQNCKTLEEFKSLAKEDGLNFTDEESEIYFNATRTGEMTDDDLTSVAGGAKGKQWVLIEMKKRILNCPFCGGKINFVFTVYEHNETKQRKYDWTPRKCSCGARIFYDCTRESYSFIKNGEVRQL